MAPNPWIFKALEVVNWYNGPFEVKITLVKRDVRGGFDLGTMRNESFLVIDDIDFKSKNKEYWKQIFMMIWNAGNKWGVSVPHKRAKEMVQRIRHERYYHRRPRFKVWDERYGSVVANWARRVIEREIDDSCKDNFRLARKGDKKALRRYNEQLESGCCGFFDVIKRCPFDWYREYYIGCNYGH